MPQQWFQNWFNSPYYHLLYSKRDNDEAQYFINNLTAHLNPPSNVKVLDIACGRGRHAIYLNKKGYNVTGIDLSIPNIRYAKQFENETLHFYVHDMRTLCYNGCFDIAFNLFTSFGYFEKDEEDINALKTFNHALKPGGILVLDYFNSIKMIKNLVADDVKTVDGTNFHIHKTVSNHKIIKTIKFEDGGQPYDFKEMVSTFTLDDFTRFFKLSSFEILEHFGSYGLDEYNAETSDRLIFICRKVNV